MPGYKCFYIDGDDIYKIPQPAGDYYKAIPKLSNKEVLFVTLYYQTLNRKPHEVQYIDFDRIKLDDKGGFRYTLAKGKEDLYNFLNYAFMTPEDLAKNECINIPKAPCIPSEREKETLIKYIQNKYPLVFNSFMLLLIHSIKESKQTFNELKDLVKKAANIKKNQEKQ